MKLSVFTASAPDYDPIQTMEKLAIIGYEGVEWRTVQDAPHDPPSFWKGNRTSMSAQQIIARAKELTTAADKHKIQMHTLAAYISCDDQEAVELHLQAAAAIGAKALRIGAGRYDYDKGGYPSLQASARNNYAKVAKLAQKYGVRALVETHPATLTPSVTLALEVLQGLDPKHVGIIWDPANTFAEGLENYRMALEIAGAYLAEVHVKNQRWVANGANGRQTLWNSSSCPVWEGLVDWPKVISLLKEFGYDGWLAFEDFSTDMPLDRRLAENHAFLHSLLA